MVKGIGVDIIEINRIKKADKRSKDEFIHKIFTYDEISYCKSQKNPYQHFAARFAAKEALLKSFGLGILDGISLKDIEIKNGKNNRPYINLKNKLLLLKKKKNIKNIFVSLSHFNRYAVAFVIIE